jgi:hypothetical protein
MWLDSVVRPPIRLHSQLFLQSKKVACPFLHLPIPRHSGEDLSRDITNHNVGAFFGQRNRGGSWMSCATIPEPTMRQFTYEMQLLSIPSSCIAAMQKGWKQSHGHPMASASPLEAMTILYEYGRRKSTIWHACQNLRSHRYLSCLLTHGSLIFSDIPCIAFLLLGRKTSRKRCATRIG